MKKKLINSAIIISVGFILVFTIKSYFELNQTGTTKSFQLLFIEMGIQDERILEFPTEGEVKWNRSGLFGKWGVSCEGKIDPQEFKNWYVIHFEPELQKIPEGFDYPNTVVFYTDKHKHYIHVSMDYEKETYLFSLRTYNFFGDH